MEIDPKTAEWDEVADAIVQTIDDMIRSKHASRLKIYILIKAAILNECEKIYKQQIRKKE